MGPSTSVHVHYIQNDLKNTKKQKFMKIFDVISKVMQFSFNTFLIFLSIDRKQGSCCSSYI